MWFAPQVCNKTVHLKTQNTSSIEKAEYELIKLETEIVYHSLFRDPWFYFVAMLFLYLYTKLRLGHIHDLLGYHFH